MKFGVNTLIWSAEYDRTVEALLPSIRERGFDGVEIPVFDPSTFRAADLRRAASANGLECTVCSVVPHGSSLISEVPEERRKGRVYVADVIKATADAGGTILAGPIYSPVGYLPGRRRTNDEWKRAVESLQSLSETLVENGVTLAIEPLNRFETYFLNTAADAAALCDQVGHPNIGVLFDTFHANIEEKDIAAGYRTVGRHLKHVHTCENDRGIPGSGHVEWSAVFQALRDLKYDGWLTIESFGFALKEISAAAAIWRDIEKTPDSIAFEGVQFLRKAWR
ncbi:MAG TPA: sugar phosphate isomerase/epimerase [Bryobacteraceae bacterium]|nr:sugar phosphate isomerase/epimerase [Bryobacteraceae bacterium]